MEKFVNKSEKKGKAARRGLVMAMVVMIAMLFFALLPFCLSLGISPASKTIVMDKDQASEQQFVYYIINNEHKNARLKVYATGELAEWIRFDRDTIDISENEEIKEFKWRMKLPKLEYGKHEGKIVVEEMLQQIAVNGTNVYAKLKLVSKISVVVPYPEKYVDVSLDVYEKNGKLNVAANITNLGMEEINSLKLTYNIFSPTDEKPLKSIATEKKSLDVSHTIQFLNTIDVSDFKPGEYSIVASVDYDGYILEVGKDFAVGNAIIEIYDYTKYFVEGKINKFEIEAKSNWNKKIKNVYSKVLIHKDGKILDELRTSLYDFMPYEKQVMSTYWNVDVPKGSYSANISLIYMNKSTEKQGQIYVVGKEKFLLVKWLPAIVAFFVLLLVFVLILLKKSKRKTR